MCMPFFSISCSPRGAESCGRGSLKSVVNECSMPCPGRYLSSSRKILIDSSASSISSGVRYRLSSRDYHAALLILDMLTQAGRTRCGHSQSHVVPGVLGQILHVLDVGDNGG